MTTVEVQPRQFPEPRGHAFAAVLIDQADDRERGRGE
jgi:hypothetical protein